MMLVQPLLGALPKVTTPRVSVLWFGLATRVCAAQVPLTLGLLAMLVLLMWPTTCNWAPGEAVPIPTLPEGSMVRRAALALLSTIAKEPPVNPVAAPAEVLPLVKSE